ncbi:site-specific integrase [Curtobacterium sp. MCBD17_019]|uniref:tyrosine-type recombinase/integrase n=1 Tax=Curtobacterium sp. MCBD17_019 TaxID=2175669 RepID=UPI0021AC6D59|nr:site-specific integrase [Curtobacterium sp. MCBD17_019]
MDRLKPSDVDALLMHLRAQGRASSTVRQVYTVLRTLLDDAVRDGLLGRNPAAVVKRPSVERQDARWLNPVEMRRLLDALDGSRYHSIVEFLSRTGLRRGEALALRWSDVDWAQRQIRVRGTLSRAGGRLVVTEPKTERSRRTVPISAPVARILDEQRSRQAADRLDAEELWQPDGFVFASATGGPIDPRNVLRAVTTAAERAGLEGVTVHSLRHTAASTMLNGGVPLTAVSESLGHSSVAITGDIYGHVAPELQRAAFDVLATAW